MEDITSFPIADTYLIVAFLLAGILFIYLFYRKYKQIRRLKNDGESAEGEIVDWEISSSYDSD